MMMKGYLYADPATITPSHNHLGRPYTQLYQHYPFLSPFYSAYEKNWCSATALRLAKHTWPVVPVCICLGYAAMIYFGGKLMDKRPGFDWKAPWRTGIWRSEAYGEGACGLWVMLFIFSKVPELGDTVFIVFRKSKLQFLHWYHHITVLLFCWHSYAVTSPTGLYFVAMNYSVHAVMYGYYYLMAKKSWPKWIPASLITVAQISQMVCGVFICGASFYYLRTDPQCHVASENVIAGAVMYGSYLYLFCDFFVRRYLFKSNKGKGEKEPRTKTLKAA